jgi:HPt (histidine-containing phosphotransfer) domain-containing protein
LPEKTPIIALTANAVSGMRDMFLREGFDDYISKPIELVKLDSILARWIPDRKKRRIIGGVNTGKVRADAPSFKAIPGLDRARGVAMTGGTEAGYRKVLAQFRKDAAERLSIFAAPPGEAAGELIAINAHAIKSAAGTIGAAELSAEAAILEEAGKTGDAEKINGILPRFFTHLAELVEAIGKALEEGGETDMKGEQATGISGKQEEGADAMLRSPLLALKEALEAKNMREIDRLFGELEKITGDAKDREAIDAISDMALLGEYQAAIESVNIMLHKAERHES